MSSYKFDPSKDKTIWKSERILSADAKEGYRLELKSYDGGTPKLELTRAYVEKDSGDWKVAKDKQRRLPWYLVEGIARSLSGLEKAFQENEIKRPARQTEDEQF